jgi:isopenicillin N synthase-like dioxygenase
MQAGVPELSLADHMGGDSQDREAFSTALMHGLQRFGFIILRDHPVSFTLLDEAYHLSARFFEQEDSAKRRHAFGTRGYTPFRTEHAKNQTEPDLKEFWQSGPESASLEPANVWPDRPLGFKDTVRCLFDALQETGRIILEALERPLGLASGFFESRMRDRNSVLRLLHYPPVAVNARAGGTRSAAHEDVNLITLLPAPQESGLELLDRDGQWIAVNTARHNLIVDSGDMMARLTNDVIPATTHRVVNPLTDNRSRYSLPFFMHPDSDVTLSCLPSCIGSGAKYADIRAGTFLQQRLRDIGLIESGAPHSAQKS